MTPFDYRTYRYDRTKLVPGVVHLGFGNFARSFIADILNDTAKKGYTDLGLVAVAPSDRQAADFNILGQQNNLYHLLRQNGREVCQRIGVLCETIIGATNSAKVIDALARDATQIATLTVTADGYFPDRPKGPTIEKKQADDISALRTQEWDKLKTPPGWIVAGLYRRYDNGKQPFIVMSCDNILFNGEITRNLIVRLSRETGDEAFVQYVEGQVVFPNTAVDRITPQQNYDAQSAYLRERAGDKALIETPQGAIHDRRPVLSEVYRELIIEDRGAFPEHLREAFSSVKVKFVDDIQPYQDRKLRLLNGPHMLFGITGKLLQIPTVREAMKDPEVRTLCNRMLEQAAGGLAAARPDSDIHAFPSLVIDRFENPHLTDSTDRLTSNTGAKIHQRFLNTPALEKQKAADVSAFAIATWLHYLQGRDESGNPFSLDAGDVGFAEELGLTIDNNNLENNLIRFLTKKDLSQVSNDYRDYAKQIVSDARLIQQEGLRAAINARYPSEPQMVRAPTLGTKDCV